MRLLLFLLLSTNLYAAEPSYFQAIGNNINQESLNSILRDLAYETHNGKFMITTGGNIGIGTTSPAAKLDVAGMIKSTEIYTTGKITTSSIYTSPGGAYFNGNAVGADYGTFAGATSTSTFSGWIDIGLEIITNDCGTAQSCIATCSTGKRVVGGGCFNNTAAADLRYVYPNSNTTFQCATTNNSALKAYAICARIK